MKFALRHSDKMVGMFALVGILFLVGSLIFVGINKRWFQSDLEYRSHFNTAEGLRPGLDLELRGFAVGRVKSLTLGSDNQVDVVLSVFPEFSDRMVQGSVIQLAVQPLGFGSSLVLHPGRSGGTVLPAGSMIPSTDLPEGQALMAQGLADRPKRRDDMMILLETLPPLISQVESVVGTVDRLLARLDTRLMGTADPADLGILGAVQGTMVETEMTVRNFGNLAAQLDSTTRQMDTVFQNLAAFSENLKDPTGLVPTLLGNEGSAARLFDDNAKLYDDLSATMEELRDLMVFMNQSTPEISVLLEEATSALAESEKVMQGLKNNPLLRGGIPPETVLSETFEGYREENN